MDYETKADYKMFKPCFSATQVAGAIGRHTYQPVHQVMYEVLKKDTQAAEIIRSIEKRHNRKPTKNFKGAVLKDREIQKSVFTALDNCKVADKAIAIELAAAEVLVEAEKRSHEIDLKKAAGIEISEKEKKAAEIAVVQAAEVLVEAEKRSHEVNMKKAAGIEVSEEEKKTAEIAVVQAAEVLVETEKRSHEVDMKKAAVIKVSEEEKKAAEAAVVQAAEVLVEAEKRSDEVDMKKAAVIKVSEEEKAAAELAIVQAAEARKIAAAQVAAAPSVAESLNAVEAACKKVVERTPNMTPEMATQLLADARGEVSKKRGLQNEDSILNTYESERKVVLIERNTRMLRMEKDDFTLVGRTDGFVAEQNRVVDSKDRTTYWKTVPVYDEIQLRVYMHLLDATDSELIEKFPNGSRRATVFVNDPEEWADIESKLHLVTRKMRDILADASSLEELVFKNTVENGD
jgi:hypothetical protein